VDGVLVYWLVLLYCKMQSMDRYETAKNLRSRHHELRIVAFTAHAMAEHRERSLAAGMCDHLTKPFTTADLSAVLERWLPKDDSKLGIDREGLIARLDGDAMLADEL